VRGQRREKREKKEEMKKLEMNKLILAGKT